MTYNNMGDVNSASGNQQEALANELKALSIAKEIGALHLVKDAYENIAMIYYKMGDYKSAYNNEVLHKVTDSIIFSNDSRKEINELKKQNEFDIKQAYKDKKDAVSAAELKQQKLLKVVFIIGFMVVLLLAFILFMMYRIKRKATINITYEKKIVELEKERSEQLLLNILPFEVANELKEKGSAKAMLFPSVTVMFTDFKEFSIISENLTPQQLVNELHECFRAFDKIIGKYNIEKIKTIGDSYMCAAGLPVVNSTHPEDIVNAALDIKEFMEKRNHELTSKGKMPFEIRIGINTGTVVAGIVGEKKFAYDIWGDAVNLASRMEGSCKEGKVNISGSTYQFVKDKFSCTYRGKIQVKNKGEVDMYFVDHL